MAMTALAALAILAAPHVPQWSMLGISISAWAILAAYGLGVRMVFLDQRLAAAAAHFTSPANGPSHDLAPRLEAATTANAVPHAPLWKPMAGFLAAAVVSMLAGPQLAEAAGEIAEHSGLGGTFVGTTFVAFCTSLPELVASLAALRLGSLDLAIGNVFGSNTFNMILLVPLDAFHPGSLFAAVSPAHVISCLAAILVTTVALMGQLYQVEPRRRLIEPDAWLMLLLIAAALGLVYLAS